MQTLLGHAAPEITREIYLHVIPEEQRHTVKKPSPRSIRSSVEIEEVRCDMNADFTEKLADSERFDEGHFWKLRRAFEKKWRDPDDVYIEVERREEERKKLGLPSRVIGSILPHSAVAQAEERWETEQERKKKRPRKHRK
jgi:hypothetical protein